LGQREGDWVGGGGGARRLTCCGVYGKHGFVKGDQGHPVGRVLKPCLHAAEEQQNKGGLRACTGWSLIPVRPPSPSSPPPPPTHTHTPPRIQPRVKATHHIHQQHQVLVRVITTHGREVTVARLAQGLHYTNAKCTRERGREARGQGGGGGGGGGGRCQLPGVVCTICNAQ
jgi:hypothetical protein